MIALFLLLVIVAIVLGIVGVVAKGLLYLLIIGEVASQAGASKGSARLAGRRGLAGWLTRSRRGWPPPYDRSW